MSLSRITILADFQQLGYDQTDPTLLKLYDRFHIYGFPNILGQDKNNISGREGDRFVIQLPVQLQTAAQNGVIPVLETITMAVVAIKAGKADFVLESNTINVGASCLFGGQQIPSYSTSRNYVTFPNDPFNAVTFSANKLYDGQPPPSTMKGYILSYALTLRYDYWSTVFSFMPGTGNCSADIQNDIQNVNNSWSNLIQNGWTLVARVTAEVQGYDGYVTPFQAQTTITVAPMGSVPDDGPTYINQTIYTDANASSPTFGTVVPNIIAGSQTKISTIYTPDGSAIPANYSGYKGLYWVDLIGSGGPTTRRYASTEIPSEANSPFSPCVANGAPATYYANGNASMNIYANGIVIVETIYDDTVLGWGTKPGAKPIIGGDMQLVDNSLEADSGQDLQGDGGINLQG